MCACWRNNADSSTTIDGLSISVHVSDVTEPIVLLTRSVQDILVAHPLNDPVWDHTDACDVSIDTMNSAEVLAGSHIVELE